MSESVALSHNVRVPPEFVVPMLEAAWEAEIAYWCDPDEKRLRIIMQRLHELFDAVRTMSELAP